MTNDLNLAARRIANEMTKTTVLGPKGMSYFMGLGVSLGIIWEVANGHKAGTANRRSPKEILEWAKDLPEKQIITLN